MKRRDLLNKGLESGRSHKNILEFLFVLGEIYKGEESNCRARTL